MVELPGGHYDLDEFKSDIEALAGREPFTHEFRSSHTSWGADGSLISAVITMSTTLAFEHLVLRIADLIKKYRERDPFTGPYSDDHFITEATRLLARQEGYRYDQLKATGLARDGQDLLSADVDFSMGTKTFKVNVQMDHGIPILKRTYRSLDQDGSN